MPLMLAGYFFALFFLFQPTEEPQLAPIEFVSSVEASGSMYEELIADTYSPPAETLSFIINAGEVLIFNLPPSIEGRQIDSYEIKKSPALSWLTGRSFFWRTLTKDTGKHEITLSGYRNGVAYRGASH